MKTIIFFALVWATAPAKGQDVPYKPILGDSVNHWIFGEFASGRLAKFCYDVRTDAKNALLRDGLKYACVYVRGGKDIGIVDSLYVRDSFYVREDAAAKKIYALTSDTASRELLLMDFSAKIGDELEILLCPIPFYEYWDDGSKSLYASVCVIDHVEWPAWIIDQQTGSPTTDSSTIRIQFQVKYPDPIWGASFHWQLGVGNYSAGLLNLPTEYLAINHNQMFHYSKDGEVLFNINNGTPDDCQSYLARVESAKTPPKLALFPNPAGDGLLVSHHKPQTSCRKTDVSGKTTIELRPDLQTEVQVSVAGLPSGVYFLSAADLLGNTLRARFVKE